MAENVGPVSIEQLLSHAGWVRGLAYSLVKNAAEADDLVQDTWATALRSPPPSGENLRGWLRRVVVNRWQERFRSGKARTRREIVAARDEAVEDGPDLLARAEAQRKVVGLVTELGEPYRTAILMRYFDDMPPRDIAERLGEPVEEIYNRLKKAQDLLRAKMRDRFGGEWPLALVPLLRWPPTAGTPPTGAASGIAKSAMKPASIAIGLAVAFIAAIAASRAWTPGHERSSEQMNDGAALSEASRDERTAPSRRTRRTGASDSTTSAEATSASDAAAVATPDERLGDRVAVAGKIDFDGPDDGPIVVHVLPLGSDPRKVSFQRSDRTVRRGAYSFDLPRRPDGTNRACEWDLQIDDPRFLGLQRRVGFSKADGSLEVPDLRLSRAANVTGSVMWAPEREGDKAWVLVARLSKTNDFTVLDSVETSPGEDFTLRLPAGVPIVLVAVAPGQMPVCREVTAGIGAPAGVGTLTLETGATISGRVECSCPLSASENDLIAYNSLDVGTTVGKGDLVIACRDGRAWRSVARTKIDGEGKFRLTGMTPGRHYLRPRFSPFAKETYAPFEAEFDVPRDDLLIRLSGGAIRVTVRSAGTPLPQAPISVQGGDTLTTITTSADGVATFFGVPTCSYRFTAYPKGFSTATVEAVAPAVDARPVEPAALDVAPTQPVTTTWTFRIADGSGRPITAAGLALFRTDTKTPSLAPYLTRDLVSTDGSFHVDGLPTGRWSAVVRPGGAWSDSATYFGTIRKIVDLRAEGTEVGEFTTTPCGRLVVAAETPSGAAFEMFNCIVRDAAQARVAVTFPNRRVAYYAEQLGTVFGRADVQPALPPGKYVVEFDDLHGAKKSAPVEVRVGETVEARVVFDER